MIIQCCIDMRRLLTALALIELRYISSRELYNESWQMQYSPKNALRGKTVRVFADNLLPYITSNNDTQDLGGYLGDIWAMIEEKLEFKSEVKSIFYDTGLELMQAGEADIMLAAVVEKEGLINTRYSQPYFYNWYHLYTKAELPKGSSLSYLKTFQMELWFAILIVFLILTLILWSTIRILHKKFHLESNISVPSCFLGVISGFMNQGYDLKLFSHSGRMLVMISLILGVVLYTAMNAVLVAKLTAVEMPFPFKSLEDIAEKGTYSLCMRTQSFVFNNFTDQNKEILPKWKGIVNNDKCLDINNQSNIIENICKDHLVILENRVIMSNILSNHNLPCRVNVLNHKLFPKSNSFLISKSFRHKELLDIILRKMTCEGILSRLQDKWVEGGKFVNSQVQQAPPEVTLHHVKGIIYIYFISIIISIAMFAFECFYYRKKNKSYLKKVPEIFPRRNY